MEAKDSNTETGPANTDVTISDTTFSTACTYALCSMGVPQDIKQNEITARVHEVINFFEKIMPKGLLKDVILSYLKKGPFRSVVEKKSQKGAYVLRVPQHKHFSFSEETDLFKMHCAFIAKVGTQFKAAAVDLEDFAVFYQQDKEQAVSSVKQFVNGIVFVNHAFPITLHNKQKPYYLRVLVDDGDIVFDIVEVKDFFNGEYHYLVKQKSTTFDSNRDEKSWVEL